LAACFNRVGPYFEFDILQQIARTEHDLTEYESVLVKLAVRDFELNK